MKNSKSYYGFKKNQTNAGYQGYTPSMVGKIALAITVPSAAIALISVIVALIGMTQALIVTLITFAISFVGSVVIMADIIIYNRKQSKKDTSSKEPKQMDIGRIVHMIIGMGVGIIIGYLIWGAKYK